MRIGWHPSNLSSDNQANDAGFEVGGRDFTVDDAGNAVDTPTPEEWLGIIPSFGISWSF